MNVVSVQFVVGSASWLSCTVVNFMFLMTWCYLLKNYVKLDFIWEFFSGIAWKPLNILRTEVCILRLQYTICKTVIFYITIWSRQQLKMFSDHKYCNPVCNPFKSETRICDTLLFRSDLTGNTTLPFQQPIGLCCLEKEIFFFQLELEVAGQHKITLLYTADSMFISGTY